MRSDIFSMSALEARPRLVGDGKAFIVLPNSAGRAFFEGLEDMLLRYDGSFF